MIYLGLALGACALGETIGVTPAYRVVKCAPLLLLALERARSLRRDGWDRHAGLVGLGLWASFAGDVAIDTSFVAGLGAFLLAHLFYLGAMGLPRAKLGGAALSSLPALALGVGMHRLLLAPGRTPPALRVPVTVYIAVLSLMLARALGRGLVDPADTRARTFCAGAVLFTISDGLIGVSHWVYPVPHARALTLATYLGGQWLIARASRAAP